MTTSVSGRCFLEMNFPRLFGGRCHCWVSRCPHGASFVTWTTVPPEQFRYTPDEKNVSVNQGSENGIRILCRTCDSQMLCQTEPGVIEIAPTALHEPIDRKPDEHWYFDSRTEWTRVGDDLPKLGGESRVETL